MEAGQPHPPWFSRVPPRAWIAVDQMMAALLTALYVIDALGIVEPHIPQWLGVALAIPVGLPLALRRRYPLTVATVVASASVIDALAGFVKEPFLPVAYAIYLVATSQRPKVSLWVLAGVEVAVLSAIFADPLPTDVNRFVAEYTRALASGLVIGASFAIGFAARVYREHLAGIAEQARQRADARLAEAARAVSEERLRIARELHDVVAHSMSVIAVQAGVGHYLLESQPDQARQALEVIELTSRDVLGEMRHLLGLLRDGSRPEESTQLSPTQGIANLDGLVARTIEAGVTPQVTVSGQPRCLPTGVGLAAYRIVQEALTNVVKHANATRCAVSIHYGHDDIAVEIVDDGTGVDEQSPNPGGHGLIGMRERVSVYGGQLTACPLPGRGFRVHARIPVDAGRVA